MPQLKGVTRWGRRNALLPSPHTRNLPLPQLRRHRTKQWCPHRHLWRAPPALLLRIQCSRTRTVLGLPCQATRVWSKWLAHQVVAPAPLLPRVVWLFLDLSPVLTRLRCAGKPRVPHPAV